MSRNQEIGTGAGRRAPLVVTVGRRAPLVVTVGRRAPLVVTVGLCVALVAALGCSHHRTKKAEINEREYAAYRTRGTAQISGQVTMTLPSGAVLDGSACQVRLTPITTESTRYMQDVVLQGGTKPWKESPDAVWWITTADHAGRFTFREVPAGSYYLTCLVAWRDTIDSSARERILWAETTVSGSDTVDVPVSR